MKSVNQLALRLPERELLSMVDTVTRLHEQMVNLVSLEKGMKNRLLALGDRSTPFVDKSYEHAQLKPHLVPGYVDAEQWHQVMNAVKYLSKVRRMLTDLTARVTDSLAVAGNEAFRSALFFYQNAKQAAKAGIMDANTVVSELESRFPGKKAVTVEASVDDSAEDDSDSQDGVRVIIEDGKIVGPVAGMDAEAGSSSQNAEDIQS